LLAVLVRIAETPVCVCPNRGLSISTDLVRRTILGLMSTPRAERVAGATLRERTVGRGWELFEPIDAAYERGDIDAAEWHRRIGAIIGPAYLTATDPRGQSGSSSTAAEWEAARRFIFAAVNRDGTFLDVGCANGHLMECAVAWLAEESTQVAKRCASVPQLICEKVLQLTEAPTGSTSADDYVALAA
jgi:hypothetical protein